MFILMENDKKVKVSYLKSRVVIVEQEFLWKILLFRGFVCWYFMYFSALTARIDE